MTDRERVALAVAKLCSNRQATFEEIADAALAAMPTWRRIPDEVREGVAPFDGNPTLLWWPYWTNYPVIGYWEFGGWSSQVCLSSGPPPKHWMPLPEPPAGEVG